MSGSGIELLPECKAVLDALPDDFDSWEPIRGGVLR
jgi:hypothetical protein